MDAATARMRLESMLAELDRSIGVLRGDPLTRWERSLADAGSVLTDADRTLAMLEAAAEQQQTVADALTRMDEGVYGRCADCGQAVPEGRL
ncbi:TraR/DksA family transcriptional regulator, partial [Streptosporangium algeriense]